MKKKIELLSPAGDQAALRAAVCSGADAVYLGYAAFGARASAANFDAEALLRAVEYAHLYHVRVHVTVNTLVRQDELEAVQEALRVIDQCGADAIIVQDLGVARVARECTPRLELHASTQMALHSAAGARFAMQQGFERVVLARECSLRTIAEVAATGVATEVFVHGALCAGVSGQCLLSSMAGGRSGNRGRCAQPCRQLVTLGDQTKALLSMRDLCLRDHLPELIEAGASSFKIEGRLKRAEYVAVVTQSYRRALDAAANGTFSPADEPEARALRQIFHRGGFTAGHAMGAEDAALCSVERVNHGGVPLGEITSVNGKLATILLQQPLHDGDSLRILDREDVEMRYAGPAETDWATLRLRPEETIRAGDKVERLADAQQLAEAQAIMEPKLPVSLHAVVRANQPMTLTASDGEVSVTVEGEPAQTPQKRATTRDEIERQLTKLGDTPFALRQPPTIETDEAFAAVSALNALRRKTMDELTARRIAAFVTHAKNAGLPEGMPEWPTRALVNEVAVLLSDASLAEPLREAGATMLLCEPSDWRSDALRATLERLPQDAWLALAPQMPRECMERVQALLAERPLAGVVLGSVGQLGEAWTAPIALGAGIPICNAKAAQSLLTNRIAFATLWPELTLEEQAELPRFACLLPCYGRERVMLLNHCPERVLRGLSSGRANCALCKAGDTACGRVDAALTDRKGYRFPLVRSRFDEGCVLNLLNALPTELGARDAQRRKLGAGMLLRFTTETPEECLNITRDYATALRDGTPPPDHGASTSGHLSRGVQ